VTRLRANDPCWCGSGRKLKRCHGDHATHRRPPVQPGRVSAPRAVPASIARPDYVERGGRPLPAGVQRLHGADLDRLRHAGRVAAEVLAETAAAIAPGVTTDALDAVAHDAYVRRGAYPSTLHYKGYTKSICTSVNEVVCHGIPDDRPLMAGDIVNLDVTAFVDGVHGDTSATFAVGAVDAATAALVTTTHEATLRAIGALRPGQRLGVVGTAVQSHAFTRGFGVVRDYGGHGIGHAFHAAPHVSHTVGAHDGIVVLEPGMVFTVEPMLTAGTADHHEWDDGWTVVTDDLLPSAQFEHTVVITDTGAEIVTVL